MASKQHHGDNPVSERPGARSSDKILVPSHSVHGSDPLDESLEQDQGDDGALQNFIKAHVLRTSSSPNANKSHLPGPVVIPQRRPGDKNRGFMEAYAPALEHYGIQQDEFISFINATNKAFRASKWLAAIQLAAVGTGFVPNSIALGVSLAVQVVAGVIAKAETRWKTNSLLDQVNERYFRPRGLYCLLMAYNPVALGQIADVDVDEVISKATASTSTKERSLPSRARNNLRNPVAGTVEGEAGLPSSVAPLVYPDTSTSTRASQDVPAGRNSIKRIANYFDDRAQARYAKESKGDVLSHPSPPTFTNRYLDPNHPATNGGLLGLVSGGHLTPNTEKLNQRLQSTLAAQSQAVQDQQAAMIDNLHQQLQLMNLPPEQEQAYMEQYMTSFQLQDQQLTQQADLINSQTGQNVSYLMIVEVPSDDEIAKAHAHLDASGGLRFGPEVEMRTVEVQ